MAAAAAAGVNEQRSMKMQQESERAKSELTLFVCYNYNNTNYFCFLYIRNYCSFFLFNLLIILLTFFMLFNCNYYVIPQRIFKLTLIN